MIDRMSNQPLRNVLFIIADDWSRIARCYGDPIVHTPNIDALASRGVVFDHAFCTSPSCAVSRACILSGQHSHTHGQYGHCHGRHGFHTFSNMTSTSKVLREQGVACAMIGKNHVQPPSVYPFDYQPTVNNRSVVEMGDALREFLKQTDGKPFYAHYSATNTHRSGRHFGNEKPHDGPNDRTYDPNEVPVPNFLPDVPEVREDLADYYRAVSRWDDVVGAALTVLEESGRAEDTLIILTTDHAMPFPGAKACSFDSGHQCPFIVSHPKLAKKDFHNQALINWVDIMPTVLDWIGATYPGDELPLAGRSILPILEDDSPNPGGGEWEKTFTSHCFHEVTNYYPYRVLRGRRYKFVHNLAPELPTPFPTDLFRSPTWTTVREQDIQMLGQRNREKFVHQDREALFDVENDPAESTNLIDQPDLQDTVKQMREELLAFRKATDDVWLEYTFQQGMNEDPTIA